MTMGQDSNALRPSNGTKNDENLTSSPEDRYSLRPFNQYINGDWYPNSSARAAKIQFIIDKGEDWLVFLSEDGIVCFDWHRGSPPQKDLRRIVNRAIELQSYNLSDLKVEQRTSYRWLIGAGVAALLGGDTKAADDAMDTARDYIDAHNREIARYWYIVASAQAAALAMLGLLAMLLVRFLPNVHVSTGQMSLGQTTVESGWGVFVDVMAGAFAGGAGALLSILSRINSTPLDARVGRWMHQLDGFVRVATGCLGALFVIIACRLNLLAGVLTTPSDPSLMGTLFLGILAGVSERLVPSLIRKVDVEDGSAGLVPPASLPPITSKKL